MEDVYSGRILEGEAERLLIAVDLLPRLERGFPSFSYPLGEQARGYREEIRRLSRTCTPRPVPILGVRRTPGPSVVSADWMLDLDDFGAVLHDSLSFCPSDKGGVRAGDVP